MAPTIYPRSQSGLQPANSYSFGPLGDPYAVTIHHSAGPRAETEAECQALNRSYQLLHQGKSLAGVSKDPEVLRFTELAGLDLGALFAEQFQPDPWDLADDDGFAPWAARGWGDIAYHFCMDDLGRFYRLRPVDAKGAHVGGWNTGNIGFMIHGNYEHHELKVAQRESIEWLFKGGIHVLTGVSEFDLRFARTHREWPNQATACPGVNLQRHWGWRRGVDFGRARSLAA